MENFTTEKKNPLLTAGGNIVRKQGDRGDKLEKRNADRLTALVVDPLARALRLAGSDYTGSVELTVSVDISHGGVSGVRVRSQVADEYRSAASVKAQSRSGGCLS